MSGAVLPPGGAQVRIGTLRLEAASSIDARRLADALPGALERALRGEGGATDLRSPWADRAAAQILAAIKTAQETGA